MHFPIAVDLFSAPSKAGKNRQRACVMKDIFAARCKLPNFLKKAKELGMKFQDYHKIQSKFCKPDDLYLHQHMLHVDEKLQQRCQV